MPLIDPQFLNTLEALSIQARKTMGGPAAGPRRAPATGASVEFADFRTYTTGDDLRRVDWNAYARLERLFLRLYRAEHNAGVTLFLDCSASMEYGEPPKSLFARRLAASLAYIALDNDDRVSVCGCTESLSHYLPPHAGQNATWRIWKFIEELPQRGELDLGTALGQWGRYRQGNGIAIVISDLLSERGYQDGLKMLQGLGQEVNIIQVLAPDELKPELRGDWRLLDAETDAPVDITVTPALLRAYDERLRGYTAEIAEFCHRRAIAFAQLSSSLPLEEAILTRLRQAQIVG